jgi:hypothetical protein
MQLIKGIEQDYFRLYKDDNNIYYHFSGKKMDLCFKSKRWDKIISLSLSFYPLTNYKIVDKTGVN